MADDFSPVSAKGSIWHRWDPHIHTPGTARNNQYSGADPWEDFLTKIEQSDPPIRALGITDYCGIDRYLDTVAKQRDGRLSGIGLIFPNVEFRLSIETKKGAGINLHLLFRRKRQTTSTAFITSWVGWSIRISARSSAAHAQTSFASGAYTIRR